MEKKSQHTKSPVLETRKVTVSGSILLLYNLELYSIHHREDNSNNEISKSSKNDQAVDLGQGQLQARENEILIPIHGKLLSTETFAETLLHDHGPPEDWYSTKFDFHD